MFQTRRFRVLFSIGIVLLGLLLFLFWQTSCFNSLGGNPDGLRLEKMKSARMYKDGKFENDPLVPLITPGSYMQMIRRQLFGTEQRNPARDIPIVKVDPSTFSKKISPGLRAIWLGHSTLLLEIDGTRILTDPVFSDRVSPFRNIGPERFFPLPLTLDQLPKIDAILISHDHYDHLDMESSKVLAKQGARFFVPLGVGAHLESWGIPETQIVEMDWWEKNRVGSLEVVCTPAVHYSGRGLLNRNSTLWSSWILLGEKHNFFHSGDTGYSSHFAEIGKLYGPFDLTSIKIGAYDWTWEGIHMNPESAIQAHLDLRGLKMIPVHWGTFNLAIHSWEEPILRALKAAAKNQVQILTPKPGQLVDPSTPISYTNWWEEAN
ncbi:hypothetical protein CH373_07185 [Leptospira perolatii]|uniref:Metallo-beta-lactamase domain-containing protein n=1 Tax=Leptospira perolatii TaxID=2023191 RepID=A0A2M9ZPI2_9LEPT|nr:MBL fold metallo-hydrolase [Leptospira perolatii]PJZ70705.1 hypothetical protein CH360_04045 [Leptospira perolatii]PJZ73915.1 hypothetical protein CH373_07185 [Leptospira perolatii]